MSIVALIEVLDYCIGCNSCVEVCPRYLFSVEHNKAVITNFVHCHDCGHCVAVCPVDAINHRRIIVNSLDEDFPKIQRQFSYDETLAFIRQRRSIRYFSNKKVSAEQINQLIELGRFAPTGHNARKVAYTIVRERDQIETILNAMIEFFKDLTKKANSPLWNVLATLVGKQKYLSQIKRNMYRLESHISHWEKGIDKVFHNASTLLLIHVTKKTATPVEDCAIAAQNIMLGAPSIKLGATFIGYLLHSWKGSKVIRDIIGIPADHGLYACLAIGYPKNKFKRTVPRPDPKVTIWEE
ncbi:MAG: nitroreductase family protein [Candidatus Heimdallarchaeota archaeon]|nr:nitroreductase family protein [Candidatus Heimdallarchaeota archaeon]